ncbi:MAG TPA: hypothetical protein VMF66_09260 [Candidatus Acidoferrum sp.]|nr:hypothetical protein [Candidatus Acidoferrum sp.]
MKALSLAFVVLTFTSGAIAAPEPRPSPAVCKADLKAWSAQETGTLTIRELQDRMDEMYACAEQSQKDEKQTLRYLNEFYCNDAELAGRSYDFIMRHGLQKQFGKEENGTKPKN